ncbi:unnamed protein product [Larinioides sclopetarius]|uniref:Cyclin-like domain-containing protein n=1 Tax=Larinioides sclopetarius TaxID=280406 RepID=A0AAV2AIN3_9ARAC
MEPGVKYILEAGVKAECDIQLITRALVIYHNFMRCIGDVHYDPAMVAAAALRLSSKTEEKELDIDGLVFLFYHMVHGSVDTLYPEGMKFDVLKKSLITVEYIMQRMLEFTLKYNIAHQFLVPFLNVLLPRTQHIDGFLESMSTTCMKFMSDFYTSRMCLNYKPEDIAIACIDTALHYHGFVEHLKMFHPWHEGFSVDLSEEKVKEMRRNILMLYKHQIKARLSADMEKLLSSFLEEECSPEKE